MIVPMLEPVLDALCPMHLQVSETGQIRHAGPTLRKLRPGILLEGTCFFDLFEVERPRAVTDMDGLIAIMGAKLHLRFRDAPRTALKAHMIAAPGRSGAVINLSFGISVVEGVRDYNLTNADFAATDLTTELLYLVEAKSAAMEATRALNKRLQGAMIAAEERAFTDTLTGLKNRRALDHVLTRLTGLKRPFTVIRVDLDFFKRVNDTLGHAAGDLVLQHAARIMVEQTRQGDTIARVGGDEFVIVLHRMCADAEIDRFAQRLIARFEKPLDVGGANAFFSASLGSVSTDASDLQDAASLLHRADIALYCSKRNGRGRNTIYRAGLQEIGRHAGGDASRDEPFRLASQ